MSSFVPHLCTIVLSFNIPSLVINNKRNVYSDEIYNQTKFHLERPDDPTLSCYLLDNGLWKCSSDTLYKLDNDDSY